MERYVVHVTKICNMECVYCYERDKTSTYTWEEIESFCRNIISNNHSGDDYSVEFLGGEPCLEFENIKKAIRLFEAEDPSHAKYFIITTNGTIVNNDIISFLKSNKNVVFSFSIDGIREANIWRKFHNKKESYNYVVNNLRRLILFDVPIDQIGVHMVTHPFNVKYMYESVYDFYSMHVRNISIGTVERAMEIGESYRVEFLKQMRKISDSINDGTFSGLYIDILESFNPEVPPQRVYIKDENGKMLGESYGKAKDDITKTDVYNSVNTFSPLADFIFNLRRDAYMYHNSKKEHTEC